MKVFHHQTLTVVLCRRLTDGFTSLTNNELPHRKHKLRTALNAAPEGMKWFVKTETFAKPYPEVKQYLEEHREGGRSLREKGSVSIASGYRVDENGRPGGGGLMIFAAFDYITAEEFVKTDPLVSNECVDWHLNQWIPETGDITME
eukprot:scaffold43448_cov51-Cyclotella_meneghiniana.AAC.14